MILMGGPLAKLCQVDRCELASEARMKTGKKFRGGMFCKLFEKKKTSGPEILSLSRGTINSKLLLKFMDNLIFVLTYHILGQISFRFRLDYFTAHTITGQVAPLLIIDTALSA
jgi:hypothetical protein